MKELIINFGLNAIIAWVIATIVFLIGAEVGAASVASAIAAGIISGVCNAFTYQFGRMKFGAAFDWKILVAQVVAAILFGFIGGFSMTR